MGTAAGTAADRRVEQAILAQINTRSAQQAGSGAMSVLCLEHSEVDNKFAIRNVQHSDFPSGPPP